MLASWPGSARSSRPMTARGPVILERHYMLIGPMELRCIGKSQAVVHDWGQRGRPLTPRERMPSVYNEPPRVQTPRESWQMSPRRAVPMGTWRSSGPASIGSEFERSYGSPQSADLTGDAPYAGTTTPVRFVPIDLSPSEASRCSPLFVRHDLRSGVVFDRGCHQCEHVSKPLVSLVVLPTREGERRCTSAPVAGVR